MRVFSIALAVLACGLTISGCATVSPQVPAEGALALSYSTGRAMQDLALPPGAIGDALAEAMDDLKMKSISRERDGAVYRLDARTEDNRMVQVTLRPHQGLTRVSCRIGWFGDEPLSKALLERAGMRLGTVPPAPIPATPPSSPGSNPFFSRQAVPDEEYLRDMVDAPYRDRPVP
jgi:Protein of unknown function (DUF3568)